MVRHILLLQLQPGVSQESVRSLGEGIDRLLAEIPGIRQAHHGAALRLPGSSALPADYALIVDFETEEHFHGYIAAPAHRRFVQQVLAPLRAGAMSIQTAL